MSDIHVAHDVIQPHETVSNYVKTLDRRLAENGSPLAQSEPVRWISGRENDSSSKCRCNRRSANVAPPAGVPFFLSFSLSFSFFPLFLSFSPTAGRRVGNVFQRDRPRVSNYTPPPLFPFFCFIPSFFLSRSASSVFSFYILVPREFII